MNGPIADYLTKRGYNVERRNALSAKYGMAPDGTLENLADDACFIDWFGRTVLCVDDETYRRAFWREVFTTGHTIGPLPRTWGSAVRELSGCPFYSNGLDIEKAIEIHRYCAGRVQDSYGIGTFLTCDVTRCEPMNIVVKLTRGRITELREWHDCVKLSCTAGKTLGNPHKCEYLLDLLGQ